MIVTIDGPAGAGKSTVAKALASRLGFRFLDTGAMYRAVAWAAQQAKLELDDEQAIADLAKELEIELNDDQVLVDGHDVTQAIRTPAITAITVHAARNAGVREHLVQLQRQIAEKADFVTEGRDQGSLVFPDAECKIFLTASAEQRAQRRVEDLRERGQRATVEEVLRDQNLRDEQDSNRPVGPLIQPEDAVVVMTDGMSIDEVVDQLVSLVRDRG